MQPTFRALPPTQESHRPSLSVHDILFILFKHKLTILICAALGLVAAAATFFFYPPLYRSEAKLLIRYVVERSAVDAVDTNSNSGGNRLAVSAIASEIEILTSWDLALQVAETIGPKRLLPDAKETPSSTSAAEVVTKGLHVDAPRGGNILIVSYDNPDPQLATLVLRELVSRYFVKHLEVHRSAGAFDFVTQQTDQVRARLNQTEDALKPLKEQAGMISLADSRTVLSADLARTEEQLHLAESEFAEQQARVKELGESPIAAPKVPATELPKTEATKSRKSEAAKPRKNETAKSRRAEAAKAEAAKAEAAKAEAAKAEAAKAEAAKAEAAKTEAAKTEAAKTGTAKTEAAKSQTESAPSAVVASQSPATEEKSTKASPTPSDPAPSGQIQQYQVVVSSLSKLRQTKLDLLSKYKPGSVQVQLTQTQISDLEAQRAELEKQFPDLPSTVPKAGAGNGPHQTDFVAERARLAGLSAKVEVLKARLQDVQAKIKQLTELGPQIAELERKKELEETNYKYFQATLEKSRIDEALDPSKIPNISAVQKPSPPGRVTDKRNKLALFLAGAGLALGLLIALTRDLVLNRTVKRPLELERQLHAPVLLSIPYMPPANGRLRLPGRAGGKAGGKELELQRNGNGSNGVAVAPWSVGHFIRPYCEAIRDRFGLYFELNQLTHKPKLVGVTSFSHAAGTSTLAAGLASALSETDEGKVLLVDVNLGPEDVHPFFKGKPAYSLATALQPSGGMDAAAQNLYLASVGPAKSGPAQLGLRRFFDLMPNLKASDFDYIIFDMPPLEQTSPTWALSPFMDKMVLIVEGDTTNKEVAKRGYSKLVALRDNVSVVFNKAQTYGPKWIQGEN